MRRIAAMLAPLAFLAAIFAIGSAVFERLAPRSAVRAYQRAANRVQGPLMGLLPGWGVVETVGRRSGKVRRTPAGGRFVDGAFWLIAGDGRHSAFVRNIEAEPRVRVRHLGRWHTGIARVLDEEDPRPWLLRLNPLNGLFLAVANPVEAMLVVRIDVDDHPPPSAGTAG